MINFTFCIIKGRLSGDFYLADVITHKGYTRGSRLVNIKVHPTRPSKGRPGLNWIPHTSCPGLGVSKAIAIPIPYYHLMNNNTLGRNISLYYTTALRTVQISRVQISRGICTPEDRLDVFSCNAQATN